MPVNESRKSALLVVAILCSVALIPARAHAQWWGARAPADYEECAESAEKAASKEAKASQLAECGVKFAARRKAGGGYSYFDFMQNRHFDIAGPNPTAEELKQIDEQYTAYLDHQRRSIIARALLEKQQQLKQAAIDKEKRTPTAEASSKLRVAAVSLPRPRPKAAKCAGDSLSCSWTAFSEKIKDFKKSLFGSSSKTNRS
jgi:hypothetical protein